MPQLTQFNALMPIEAFQAGRDQRNTRLAGEAQNALMSGDREGAMRFAQRTGDAGVMSGLQEQIAQMDEAQRQQARERANAFGQVGASLLQVPYEQRRSALMSPQVQQQLSAYGIDAQQMAQFDPTDENLYAVLAPVAEISDLLSRTESYTLGANDTRVDGVSGRQTVGQAGVEVRQEEQRSNMRGEQLRERGINIDAGRLSLDRDRFNEDRRQFDTTRADAQTAAADAAANPPAPDYSAEEDIRTEAERAISEFRDIEAAFTRVRASAENPSAAGDLALIFNFMKMQDPGSTVREGEFATAQNAAGVPDRLRAMYNNVANGQRMTPEQRADFVGRSEALYSAQRQLAEQRLAQYRELTTARQLDERFAIPRFAEFPERSPAPTAPPAQNAPADDLTNRAGRYLVQ